MGGATSFSNDGEPRTNTHHGNDQNLASAAALAAGGVMRPAEEIEKPHVHGDSDSDDAHSTASDDHDGPSRPRLQPIISRPSGSRPLSRAPSRTISLIHDGIETRHERSLSIDLADAELGPELQEKTTTTAPDPSDPDLVTWTEPGENPKTWPFARKWTVVFVASMFTLMSPLSSTIIAPGLTTIGEDFNIDDSVTQFLTLSIFILGFSFGPLL